MAATTQKSRSLRMSADEAKQRISTGQPATIFDARGEQAWVSGDSKITGAVRVDPAHFHPDFSWPKDQLTLVYCT
jgi:hypothetical protein